MATSTSRRAEGYQRPQHKLQHSRRAQQTTAANNAKHAQIIATQTKTRTSPNILQQSSSARMKRPLDPIDNNHDPLRTKRTRITVEILARSISEPVGTAKSIAARPQIPTRQNQQSKQTCQQSQQPQPQSQSQSQSQSPNTATATAATATATATAVASTQKPTTAHYPAPARQHTSTTTDTNTTTTATENGLTKHKEKVINGIRHELDRLQPSAADFSSAKEHSGRKLRSQEATRFKSELSAYFPDYDEVIGNDPKEQHILNPDTPIVVIDTGHPQTTADAEPGLSHQPHSSTVRLYNDSLFTDLNDSQRIDFAFLEARYNGHIPEDPLPDSYFHPGHRKAERLEKSIRNTERGRAQHEKDQIIRLLNDLQGHDWLRTMGVNGVTESRKKTFEPARDHFIRGCQAILEKFRLWSQEEKKRKLEKERALAEEARDDEGDEDDDEEDEYEEDEDAEEDQDEEVEEDDDMSDAEAEESAAENASEAEPPDYSDVDASARQLHDEEALARAKIAASSSKKSRSEPPPKLPEPAAAKEFASFFEKRHQRDAALSKGRRRGRTLVAWGHPIPDMMEYDFDLPEEYRDTDTLKAHERQKRRDRRQHRH
ncbi:something about silencing, SAS, complex subunit 4-domain-containing protein [Biscogniauxia marginata]|nr:something about silencing, SAS, complex subunit 4-domain-containing protein [Biscogniauxia marginata]